jgi:ABC-type uncharacterized transport system ATPase subunit
VEELRRGGGAAALEIKGGGFTPEALARLRALPGVQNVAKEAGAIVITWAGEARRSEAVRVLVEGGASVEEVLSRRPTFEDAFLKLVKDETTEER